MNIRIFLSYSGLIMPDKRAHRGQHPADAKLFAPDNIEIMRQAVADLSMLLTKGYAEKSSLKLVGDRFALTQRQRLAILRCCCSDQQLESRSKRKIGIPSCKNHPIAIDGYNLLITIESAISGGFIFIGRDGTYKDLASIHSTYRKVEETIPALELIGHFLEEMQIQEGLWFLDSPVSNSGRLKTIMEQIARDNHWNWQIKLTISPDAELIKNHEIIASSDSVILDGCKKWINLAAEIIRSKIPTTKITDIHI